MKDYAEIYAACPFFDKTDRGYIQCEGLVDGTHNRMLFHDMKDGHPLDDKKKAYMERFCNGIKSCENCRVHMMLMTKYEVIKR